MRARTDNRLRHLIAALACMGVVLYLYLFAPKWIEPFDAKITDLLFVLRQTQSADERIVIIDIDEQSLGELGQWPWPRHKIATLIERLNAAGIGIIGLDMVFAEVDNSSPSTVLREYNLSHPLSQVDYDRMLADTLAHTPVVAGYALDFKRTTRSPSPGGAALIIEKGIRPEGSVFEASGIVANIPTLQQSAFSSGFFNTFPDDDGVVRYVPLIVEYDETLYPSLALEMIRLITQNSRITIHYDALGIHSIALGDLQIPTDRMGRITINYRARKAYTYISAADIYHGRIDPKVLEGRIALLGTSAIGLRDIRTTPFSSDTAGVEIHATIIDNMLNRDFLSRPSWASGAELSLSLALIALISGVLAFLPVTAALIGSALLLGVYAFGAYALFASYGLILSNLYPLIAAMLALGSGVILNYLYESRQKEFIKQKFSQKVSASVVENIIANPNLFTLDAHEREVSIFFSDIRGFTELAERFESPQKLIDLLNRYMQPMSEIIIRHHGTIDKYIGDAIMAYWNAPTPLKAHQDHALKSALEQMRTLAQLNEEFARASLPRIEIGIGLHSGSAVVGEMGSHLRSDYTIIGDSVNLTSRLEGLTKYYGVGIIISDAFRHNLEGSYIIRKLDTVRVKGKHEAIAVYEVIDTPMSEALAYELSAYEVALEHFTQARFESALLCFDALYARYRHPLYALYRTRCAHFKAEPPLHFDGVFDAQSK